MTSSPLFSLFSPREKKSAATIRKLADDPDMAKIYGMNGRSKILRDNDYKTEMSKVNSLYLEVVEKVE